MSLAEAVRRLRARRYLSQAELATAAGISRTTIARIEAGGKLVVFLATDAKIGSDL